MRDAAGLGERPASLVSTLVQVRGLVPKTHTSTPG
jgi:hypothetical protein